MNGLSAKMHVMHPQRKTHPFAKLEQLLHDTTTRFQDTPHMTGHVVHFVLFL